MKQQTVTELQEALLQMTRAMGQVLHERIQALIDQVEVGGWHPDTQCTPVGYIFRVGMYGTGNPSKTVDATIPNLWRKGQCTVHVNSLAELEAWVADGLSTQMFEEADG